MRYILVAAVAAVGFASPSLAAVRQAMAPSWNDCFRLSVFRGTDAWMEEQQAFITECLGGNIAFGDDFPRHAMRLPRSQEDRQ